MIRIGFLYVDDFYQPRSQRVGSLGLASIAAWLEQEISGIETQIGLCAGDIIAFEPDLVGISAYTETLPAALAEARKIKAWRDLPIVLGGPHIATNAYDLHPEIDIGVVGEGEEAMESIVRAFQANQLHPAHLKTIPGLSFHENGKIVNTGRCPPIQNLDRLAHPNRAKMFAPLATHFPDFKPLFHVHTARGCPYRCTFCSAPLVNPSWRFHSPEWVVEELESIAKHYPDCDQITLSDDLFTLKKSRLEALVKAIRAAGLHKRFFFLCSSRSNTLSPEICRLLVDMNMLLISFGMESGSDRLIKQLKGVGTSHADYQRVLELCQCHGLYAHGNLIIGDQHEEVSDLKATWDLLAQGHDLFATAYVTHMTPFPGTRVWEQALEAQRFDPQSLDYRQLNLEFDPQDTVLLSTHYSREFYTEAHQKFKNLSEGISARFTEESGLLKDLLSQERWVLPEMISELLAEEGWEFTELLSPFESVLNRQAGIHPLESKSLLSPSESKPLLLNHYLETLKDPGQFLAELPARPLISIDYHMGNYYHLLLLLLGKWQEGVWGGRQRLFLRHFTLKTLVQLFESNAYQLKKSKAMKFRLTLPDGPIKLLRQYLPVPEPETFAWITLWQPIK
ncbi:hypothetical protein COW36_18870 [bacterium (Candidatus Blackallbacteria) CG17_big_fil_post_rev_8_21_14_2_50_48_46]|uniref:Uncharacterized protein n=1 Tax=bacterium (Candidatus Blackallbacteria) CG17_big_fil_post_rev_8_21_14_2_50_48_46 TaxID=2014261 RepID=A0A2M7FZX0_9BACT|nr:MAG: hypothetical protein COW64_25600 [bacterium (Candidatus Blackallbacteria) CG18_big_fil_WC_8_21_14_2_50_49_26]PIW14990.1 MAG: hypothetical protein COW36_18870 [bacterium (Candidatus Blackallbacteria) CG17_big_fil_post_rev_8_21_14_2_50_48_46]PIW50071.1 MAG: hypothetical protein COW20_03805 [bacterium (Candidatus Blackallbacteria) CG13_big_fil_rev_8_21_14_2_50_49_14]